MNKLILLFLLFSVCLFAEDNTVKNRDYFDALAKKEREIIVDRGTERAFSGNYVDLFENNDSQLQNHYLELAKLNGELWDIENWIRDCEREKRFDKEFVELARSVYITNDKRSDVKMLINLLKKHL